MTRERSLVRAIVRHLEAQGAWVLKVVGGPRQRAGVPDLLVCWRGRFVALEVKRPGEKPTPLQSREMQAIIRAGGVSTVVSSVEEVEKVLEDVS